MSLFGLNSAQLLPIVEAINGAPVVSFSIDRAVPLQTGQGVCGDKCIADLSFQTAEGHTSRASVFVKKFAWKGKSEAAHYRHLSSYKVPTPHLYGVIPHNDGDEILFMERLPQIGFDRQSETEWRKMLSLLARFNACPVTTDYVPFLHPYEQGGKVDGWWITGLTFPTTREEVEANIHHWGVEESEMPTLCKTAVALFERVTALPQGLLHQDFLADNLGWRGDHEEMVVFDVHKNCLGPRFADVGPYLGLPDWSNTAAFVDGQPSRREALTRHYLDEYARFGGEEVSLQSFLEETSLLFWAHKIAILLWLTEQQDAARINAVLNYLRKSPA